MILEKHGKARQDLIPLLQDIQARLGYVSRDSVTALSREIGLSEHEIYGVATFYAQFKFERPGRHALRVCLGTACHVRGGAGIMEAVERRLGVGPGQTSNDGLVSLDRVACIGCCALAPVVVMDQDVHGSCTSAKVGKILDSVGTKK